ncbi:MAG TPA: hypothetical protein PK027_14460 [Aquimonas sp.]|nr:hypothetical protein [Aquimonas sp.]
MNDVNDIFNEFARCFVGTIRDDTEVAFPGALRREQLDGSLESLHVVDDYLRYLHKRAPELTGLDWQRTVLRAGAYVGEVIRHAAPEGSFSWVDYDEYIPQHPKLKELIPERTVATCAFLVNSSGAMSMPLNKIARFIDEGPDNSVHFFAKCDLNRE